MIIRRMRAEDIPQIVEMAASHPEAPHWPEGVYARALDPECVPERVALVAESPEGRLTGFVVTGLILFQAELESIVVARGVQRQGTGAQLLRKLFEILGDRRITEVMLEVRESNQAARAFYRCAGFTETGRRAGYYAEPKEDAILLWRSIL